ncbi:hypothetical protein TrVE_jg1137 [Triparma verrucosa]|uniref:DUF6816 domain-containing protein n=1 Tax=Triparma verrucosa TaxID=1606542 RepID=A0A9W7KWN6_9STRA|nr:hypothetical protein TrVE_jg1137 [Triparma verrucosa]
MEFFVVLCISLQNALAFTFNPNPNGAFIDFSRRDTLNFISSSFGSSVVGSSFVTDLPRVPEVGQGTDIMSNSDAYSDAVYPKSLKGLWEVEKTVVSSEGDVGQAETAWFLLGGAKEAFKSKRGEIYETLYVNPTSSSLTSSSLTSSSYSYEVDGESVVGVVLDRGFELKSRADTSIEDVSYDSSDFNHLTYYRQKQTISIDTVQRQVLLPDSKGWGSNELLRITTPSPQLYRAVKVSRRFRRSYEGEERVIEGIEIVKTYRVMDGIAGTEYPTSTTKSTLKLRRPK